MRLVSDLLLSLLQEVLLKNAGIYVTEPTRTNGRLM